jgi:hypothetical protein
MKNYTTQIVKPINCLWLVIDVNVKSNHWGSTRSLVIVAENEEEVKAFVTSTSDKGDAVSSKARIDCYPNWPENSLEGDHWMDDSEMDIEDCKIIQIGLANPDVSKGILVVDNIGS